MSRNPFAFADDLDVADENELQEKFVGKPKLQPELKLIVELFHFAIVEQDLSWVNSDANHPFSFRHCCEHLGIDPIAARRALNQKIVPRPRWSKGRKLRFRRVWRQGFRCFLFFFYSATIAMSLMSAFSQSRKRIPKSLKSSSQLAANSSEIAHCCWYDLCAWKVVRRAKVLRAKSRRCCFLPQRLGGFGDEHFISKEQGHKRL